MGNIFSLLFFNPIINLIVVIIHGFDFIHVPGALGLGIIALTALIRLALYPLNHSQLRSSQKMQSLNPKIQQLKERHKADKQQLQVETMKLYKEHGVNPAAACVPTLIQIPILIGLYQAILTLFNSKGGLHTINNVLYKFVPPLDHLPDPHFLGFNLANQPAEFVKYGSLLLLIPVITAGLQFIQAKMMAPQAVKPYPSDSPKEKKQKSETEDAMNMMQSQMIYMMPLMIGFFSWQLPIGLALYWNTMTIFGILQQYQIQGLGGLAGWKDRLDQWTKNKKK